MRLSLRLVIAMALLTVIQQRLDAQSAATSPRKTVHRSESHLPVEYAFDDVSLVDFRDSISHHHSTTSCDSPACCDDIGHCRRECVWAGDFPGSILIPGSSVSMKLGGYTKLDLIRDFDAIGNTDKFDTTTIPTDGTNDQNWRLHARQTRLNLDLRNRTAFGEVRGFVEGDFFGDGNALRLRHAYAEVGALLAGQTWSYIHG